MMTRKEIWDRSADDWESLLAGQCLDRADENNGAYLDASGVPIPGHTGTALLVAGLVYAGMEGWMDRETVGIRVRAALGWMERVALNENGRISPPDCNPDSGPDTAFVVQLWGALLDAPERDESVGDDGIDLVTHLRRILGRMLSGLPGAGFHTPNHRWVMASALAWGARDTGDAALLEEMQLFLAEGPDGDEEGFYPERSAGVYDAVSNRAFHLLYRWAGWDEGLPDVQRNIGLLQSLFNSDGTVDTKLSTRQDRGAATVPDTLLDCFYRASAEGEETEAAAWALFGAIWNARPQISVTAGLWLAWEVLRRPVEKRLPAASLSDGEWFICKGTVWRARRNGWSFRAMTADAYPLVLRSPGGEEFRMAFAHAYMGTGSFRGDRFLETEEGAWSLRHDGRGVAFRPAYELPLGHLVRPEEYEERRGERPLRDFPAAASTLIWRWTAEGAEVKWSSEYSGKGLYAQWVVDFPASVSFRKGEHSTALIPGQVHFLASGEDVTWSGQGWSLDCGSGSSTHRMNPMRDALAAPAYGGRVVIALRTPFVHTFSLRFYLRDDTRFP